MSYGNEKLVSDDAPKPGSSSGAKDYQHWRGIRERSVAEFVNRVSAMLDAPQDRGLRQQLYETVSSDGATPVRWQNTTYTGQMLLSLFYRNRDDAR